MNDSKALDFWIVPENISFRWLVKRFPAPGMRILFQPAARMVVVLVLVVLWVAFVIRMLVFVSK